MACMEYYLSRNWHSAVAVTVTQFAIDVEVEPFANDVVFGVLVVVCLGLVGHYENQMFTTAPLQISQ